MSATVVRRIDSSESAMLRQVRLRALETDPASFGSTYEFEAAFAEQVWAERAASSAVGDDIATILAIRDDEPVGVVTAVRDAAERHVFHFFSLWVAPDARREAIGRRLLTEIEGWSISCGGTIAQLSVAVAATPARRLYETAGYKPERVKESASGSTQISLLKHLKR